MRKLIRKLLRVIIENKIENWEQNISDFGRVLTTIIWSDSENGERFYLFVSFTQYGNVESFSYSFMLIDKDGNPLSNYLTERNEVAKHIPNEIKNSKLIFPIIENLTRKLLNNMTPEEIYRKTVEPLTNNSLERYHRITNIMIDEYNYKLKETYLDNDGCTVWKLIKKEETEKNKNMDESYNIGGIPNPKQILHDTFDWVLPKLPKIK
jgi:hypothetical protein